MWLTRLALRYPISTFLFAVTILVLGFVSFRQLPVDLLPNITVPVVSAVTFYSGAGPLDMEQTVTVFLERGVSSVNDVDYVQSSTREGVSLEALQKLLDRFERLSASLELAPDFTQYLRTLVEDGLAADSGEAPEYDDDEARVALPSRGAAPSAETRARVRLGGERDRGAFVEGCQARHAIDGRTPGAPCETTAASEGGCPLACTRRGNGPGRPSPGPVAVGSSVRHPAASHP